MSPLPRGSATNVSSWTRKKKNTVCSHLQQPPKICRHAREGAVFCVRFGVRRRQHRATITITSGGQCHTLGKEGFSEGGSGGLGEGGSGRRDSYGRRRPRDDTGRYARMLEFRQKLISFDRNGKGSIRQNFAFRQGAAPQSRLSPQSGLGVRILGSQSQTPALVVQV